MVLKLPIMFDGVGGLQRTRGAHLELPTYLNNQAAFCLSNLKKPGLQEVAGAQRKETVLTQVYYRQASAFNLVRFGTISVNPSLWT